MSKTVSLATPLGAPGIGPSSVAKGCLKTAGKTWILGRPIDAPGVARLDLEIRRESFIDFARPPTADPSRLRIGA